MSKYETIMDEKKTSRLMPNYKKAVTSERKFVDYSLNPYHVSGKNKASVYKAALGYTQENYHSLMNQIHNAVTSGKASLISMRKNEAGVIEYNYRIAVKGPNGNIANVIAKYGIRRDSAKPHLITNYVERKAK